MEEAVVPDENIVGGEGNGWLVAITTLMFERAGLGGAPRFGLARPRNLIELIKERGLEDDPLIPPEGRRAPDRHRGDAPRRAALADGDDEDRHPRPRGLARQVGVGDANQAMTELASDIVGPEGLERGTP